MAILILSFGVTGAVLFLGPPIARLQRERVELTAIENGFLLDLLNGVETIKATGATAWCLSQWRRRFFETRVVGLERERKTLSLDSAMDTANIAMQVLLLIWGGYMGLRGRIALGSLMAFLLLAAIYFRFLVNLLKSVRKFFLVLPEVELLGDFFQEPHRPSPLKAMTRTIDGPIVVSDLWFRYADEAPWIYQGYNLAVEPGSIHLVRGPSGSGKSTLLKLVSGLYVPAKGSISIGGHDPSSAARIMIYLPQSTSLLNATILENLEFYSGRAPVPHLLKVAEEVGLSEWVDRLPQGFETLLSNNGSNLSGGQRQHLVLAAALASNRQLFLMDEAMSRLDWVTRRKILHSPHFQGRTGLYASHEERLLL